MPEINILSPHVADLIAAGEVVDRPASVVKELMENAFDAGARTVTVEIRSGGITYIRVTDDGKGMAPEDAGVAFLRHATSKLHDERGLESIGTFGFRGEALAAISAVSRIEMTTRQKGAPTGVRMTLTAGDIQEMYETGCPEGTTMIVRDLFYNTPARLKFLKSDRAEGTACVQAALKCALGRPEISVRCIKDGKEEFFSPGDGKLDSCVYHLLGRDAMQSLLPCRSEPGEIQIQGFIVSPEAGRGNRSNQYFFVNGRAIKSQILQSALEMAYRNRLLTGRYPTCVLYIDIAFGAVDVNVHPTKAEVKFSQEKKVFDAVYYACMSALGQEDRLSGQPISPPPAAPTPQPKPSIYDPPAPVPVPPAAEPPRTLDPAPKPVAYDDDLPLPSTFLRDPVEDPPAWTPTPPAPPASEPVPEPEVLSEARTEPFRVAGEVLATYIIVEHGDKMTLIDKHAAHERMHFDRLCAQTAQAPSQTLLAPELLKLNREDFDLVQSHEADFSCLGYELEPYGDNTLLLRAVPAGLDAGEARACIEEVCDTLRTGRSLTYQQAKQEILKTVACKAAIKAGKRSEPEELRAVAEKVLSGEVKYCPHGRPVSVTYTKYELDKLFDRVVN
ncbi:MAG: DNA mismatch repair endonuclease MutL [Oscillospiraceae bacterium]|jgi:DNA mismatch repair protein MutL|nr:DNA mismatch repair endonuclease MutL [Oscillospiraceae bacterium]